MNDPKPARLHPPDCEGPWTLALALVIAAGVASCSGFAEARRAPRTIDRSTSDGTPHEAPYCVQIEVGVEAPASSDPGCTEPSRDGPAESPAAESHQCTPGHLQDCTEQCRRGHAGSCVLLGVMYVRGQGVPVDEVAAADLFARACRADNLAGCNNLGIAFSEGQGRKVDHRIAVELFRQVCYGGTLEGCVNLGELYETGRGVAEDHGIAAARYEQACRGGLGLGCALLGLLYESGRAGTQDKERALSLYAKACTDTDRLLEQCDGRDPDACAAYGVCLVHGLGIPADEARGVRQIERGCAWGLVAACDKARSLGKRPRGAAPSFVERL